MFLLMLHYKMVNMPSSCVMEIVTIYNLYSILFLKYKGILCEELTTHIVSAVL
jgi:hypothetical protein